MQQVPLQTRDEVDACRKGFACQRISVESKFLSASILLSDNDHAILRHALSVFFFDCVSLACDILAVRKIAQGKKKSTSMKYVARGEAQFGQATAPRRY